MDEMNNHELFMKRCFELAKLAGNNVKSNPNVGSVLVHQNKIVAEGYHEFFGGLHAERNAINKALDIYKELSKSDLEKIFSESTLYVSLEPCQIHGKTPPCSDIILSSGIKKVVISILDPNPKISGKSVELLRSKKCKVITGVLEKDGNNLISPFIANLKARPFILLKFAQSSDAYFGKRGKQHWISGPMIKRKVHQWRSEVDGILIGHQTAVIDNPKLTTRLVKGNSPLRIVFDDDLSIPRTHHLWEDQNPTIFITQSKESVSDGLKSIQYIIKDEHYLESLLSFLFQNGIYRLMIEGGAQTLKNFIAKDLWDEARIIRSNKAMVSGIRAPYVKGRLFNKEVLDQDTIEYVYNLNIQ